MKHFGRHTHRFRDNPEEKRIAEAWDKWNENSQILAWLLDRRPVQTGRPLEPSDIEVTAAATVVQWLGSHVGQCFLRDLGYERVLDAEGKRTR